MRKKTRSDDYNRRRAAFCKLYSRYGLIPGKVWAEAPSFRLLKAAQRETALQVRLTRRTNRQCTS